MASPSRSAGRSLVFASLLATLWSAAPSALAADDGRWVHRGPYGVGVRTLALEVTTDAQGRETVWAGSASGGLWVRRPGATWSRVDTGQHRVLGVGAIAAHPRRPEILYAGTGAVYKYRQALGGWDAHTTRGSYGVGILASRDGGATWEASLPWQPADRTGVQDLAIVPESETAYTVWAATTEGVYRLRATAGAAAGAGDWEKVLDVVMATSLSPNPADPRELLAACGSFQSPGHGLYRTTDGGETWQKLAGGLPATFAGKAMLGRSPSQPAVVYASIGNQTDFLYSNETFACQYSGAGTPDPVNWLLRSADGGLNWTTQTTKSYAGSQGWYSHAVAVSPRDPARLYIAGTGLQRSFDGGKSFGGSGTGVWTIVNDATGLYFMADTHEVVVVPRAAGEPETLYFASDQGVYHSRDGGLSIQAMNEGYDTVQLYRAATAGAADLVAATAQDLGPGFFLYRGAPGGAAGTWQWVAGYGHEAGAIAYDPRGDLFYVGQHFNSRVGRYRLGVPAAEQYDAPDNDNGGPLFIPDVNPFRGSDKSCLHSTAWAAPLAIAPAGDVLYAARDVLYRSTRSPFEDQDPSHAARKGASRTLALAWQPTGFGKDKNPIAAIAVDPAASARVLVATDPRYEPLHVYASPDGGFTWHDLTGKLPPTGRPPRALVLDAGRGKLYAVLGDFGPGHVWAADFGDGAWTGNGGKGLEWKAIDGGGAGALPDVDHADLAVDPETGDLYAANDWGVYRSRDGGASWQAWSDGLYPAVRSMQLLVAPERRLRLVTHGNGLWERPLPR